MDDQSPPPLPTAFKTYARAIIYALTAAAFLLFADLFLVPKIELFWEIVGKRGPILGQLITGLEFVRSNLWLLMLILSGTIVLLESKSRWWRRNRSIVVEGLIYGLIVTVLALLAAIATVAIALAPLVGRR